MLKLDTKAIERIRVKDSKSGRMGSFKCFINTDRRSRTLEYIINEGFTSLLCHLLQEEEGELFNKKS